MTTSHHILLVEDEPTLQRILGSVLSDSGHSVESVGTAEQALERLQNPGPAVIDVVLSDKNLPAMNGLDLLAEVRAQDQREATARGFILVTGYPSRDSAARVLELGGDGYLVKPFRSLLETAQEVRRVVDSPLGALRTASEKAQAICRALAGDVDDVPAGVSAALYVLEGDARGRIEERLADLGVSLVESEGELDENTVLISTSLDRLKRARRQVAASPLILLDAAPAFAVLVDLIKLGGAATFDPSSTTVA